MNMALLGPIATAAASVGGPALKFRPRWGRLMTEITATRELAETFAENSPTRAKLLDHADQLVDVLRQGRMAELQTRRQWLSIIMAVAGSASMGIWASGHLGIAGDLRAEVAPVGGCHTARFLRTWSALSTKRSKGEAHR